MQWAAFHFPVSVGSSCWQASSKKKKDLFEKIVETAETELRAAQNWKDSGEPSSSREKCGRKEIFSDHDQFDEIKL